MYARFRKYLSALGPISNAEFELIKSVTRTQKIKKRYYLLQEGDVCNYTAWIAKGCLRLFLEDSQHKEHILGFGFEGDWLADRQSLVTNTPSKCNIEALEDSEVMLVSPEAANLLVDKVPVMVIAYLQATRELLAKAQERAIANLSLPAEEKVQMMEEHSPQALKRVPQHMIASYLGMTPATLSRIRKRRADEDTA